MKLPLVFSTRLSSSSFSKNTSRSVDKLYCLMSIESMKLLRISPICWLSNTSFNSGRTWWKLCTRKWSQEENRQVEYSQSNPLNIESWWVSPGHQVIECFENMKYLILHVFRKFRVSFFLCLVLLPRRDDQFQNVRKWLQDSVKNGEQFCTLIHDLIFKLLVVISDSKFSFTAFKRYL